LMAGLTTGVPMSPGYGGYESTTLLSYYSTLTNAAPAYYTKAPKYYTTKASEYYTTTYASPSHYTEAPKYASASSYTTTTRLTTQRLLLLRTTLNRNTTPRLQFTTPQPTLHLATTPRHLSTTLPRHLSIIPLLTLLRPATLKLRHILVFGQRSCR
jgi:hypothetical protein